jgi:hypothetical protein
MSEHDDFAFELREHRGPDSYESSARDVLREFFESNDSQVFFGNQLAIRNEDLFFHWITYRALSDLVEEGLLKSERRGLAIGSELKLFWHRRHRYYRRDASRVVQLVNEYGSPNMCAAVGLHGEQMILGGFARRQFVLRDHSARAYGDRKWEETEHNLDFIFERDGVAYGVEVKNTLSYMDEDEFQIKIRMCEHLGIVPVFAVRMLPKSWTIELIKRGGYAMILKYQLYPWSHLDLAKRVASELGLPVDAPRKLKDGTIDKFVNWHSKKL